MHNSIVRVCRDPHVARGPRRRSIVGGLVATAAVSPLRAQPRPHRIGVIASLPPPPNGSVLAATLAELGYREGENLVIERRPILGHPERLPSLAKDIVNSGVEVVVVEGDAAALAVKAASPTMPIVLIWSIDPVGNGLAASLGRPGGSVTGLTHDEGIDQGGKRLQLYKEALPALTTIAALCDSTPGIEKYWPKIHSAEQAFGIRVVPFEIHTSDDVGPALEKIRKNHPSALWCWGGPATDPQTAFVGEFALAERLPAFHVSTFAVLYGNGFLLGYSPDYYDFVRRAAVYVVKILKGARPADLPIEQPSKFELVISLKTAKAIGVTIPAALLLRADRVVQ